jgi:t-SNARE complex subunit (syntaxin)
MNLNMNSIEEISNSIYNLNVHVNKLDDLFKYNSDRAKDEEKIIKEIVDDLTGKFKNSEYLTDKALVHKLQRYLNLTLIKYKEIVNKYKQTVILESNQDNVNTNDTTDIYDEEANQLEVRLLEHGYSSSGVNSHELLLQTEKLNDLIKLEKDIFAVNELFQDIAILVNDQQPLLDNIEQTVVQSCVTVENGNDELEKAKQYKKSARKKICCLICCLMIVFIIILGILGVFHN